MLVYRLVRQPYARQLTGEGAALFGGRWNSVGHPVIYASEYRSLAVLEYRANNPLPIQDLMMLALNVPDTSMQEITIDSLPESWQKYSYESPVAHLGDEWLTQQTSLMLKVPSAIVPEEFNVLINPLHPLMSEVQIEALLPFLIDSRMYSAGE